MSQINFEDYEEYEEERGRMVGRVEDVWDPAKKHLSELWRAEGRTDVLTQEWKAYGEHIIGANHLPNDKLTRGQKIDLPKISMSKYISDESNTVEEIAKAHLKKCLEKDPSDELIKKHVRRILKINDLTSHNMTPEGKPLKTTVIILPKFNVDNTDKTFFSE